MTTVVGLCKAEAPATVLAGAVAIPAGFPSPAEDYYEGPLDLNRHLIERPASTYLVRVSGWSMIGAGISDGDELIVDRSAEPLEGRVVVALVDGEFTVKRLSRRSGRWWLKAEGPDYPDLVVTEETSVWGVVRTVIHHV
jgi:DNA polymerase V